MKGICLDCGTPIGSPKPVRCQKCANRALGIRRRKGQWVKCQGPGCPHLVWQTPCRLKINRGRFCCPECFHPSRSHKKTIRVECPICTATLVRKRRVYNRVILDGKVVCCETCKPILYWMRRNIAKHGREGVRDTWARLTQRWVQEHDEVPLPTSEMNGAFNFARWLADESLKVLKPVQPKLILKEV